MPPRAAHRVLILATALVLLAGAVAAGRVRANFGLWLDVAIGVQVAGGGLVALAAGLWRRVAVGRLWLAAALVFAVGLRVILILAPQQLSDDAARYHWDGKCLAHGGNPYLHAPSEPAVAHLRGDTLDDQINHPSRRTCYPPAAQVVFAAAYRLTPGSLLGFQLLCLVAEIAAWLLLLVALRRRAVSAAAVLYLAWSPLVVWQGYLPGHVDTLTLPGIVALLLLAERGRGAVTGAVLAVTGLVKPLPLWHAPALAWRLGRRQALRLALIAALVVVAAYLPFAGAGLRLFESTWAMAVEWSHNGSVAALLELALPTRAAHVMVGVLLLGLLAASLRYGRDLPARMLLAQTAFVVCTPTLFPWYLIGLLPLLALRPVPSLMVLVALVPLADEVVAGYHATGAWDPATWPRLVIYLPFYLLLLRDLRPGGPLVAERCLPQNGDTATTGTTAAGLRSGTGTGA